MKISLLQLDSKISDFSGNLVRAKSLAAQAKDSDILVLPETFMSGFVPDRFSEISAAQNEIAHKILSEVSHDKIIIAGLAHSADGAVRNSAFVYQNSAQIHRYDKIFLFSKSRENEFVKAGERIGICEIKHGAKSIKIGVAICYDLRFGEIFRVLSQKGAQIIFVIAQFPLERIEHFTLLARARAVETQCFVCALNSTVGGHSLIVAPDGEILCEMGEEQGCFTKEINLDKISLSRARMDILADMRNDIKEIL